MFPPADDHEPLPLERCMRFYAHFQDSGAFFVAVLEKQAEFKAAPEDIKVWAGQAPAPPAATRSAAVSAASSPLRTAVVIGAPTPAKRFTSAARFAALRLAATTRAPSASATEIEAPP